MATSFRKKRRVFGPLFLALLTGLTTAGAAGAATRASSVPKYGGTLTLGGTPAVVLDWTQVGFSGPGNSIQLEEFGSLFENPLKAGGAFIPDLATGYSFNKSKTQFTVTLRHGLKFSDGSPLNAQAVAWNWSSVRDAAPLAFTAQYMTSVKSVKAVGKYTVVVNFTQPDAVWISDIAAEPLGLMASPTSLRSLGQNQFNLTPVGAGPFRVTQNIPGQQIVLTKNRLYWNPKSVYLSSIVQKNTGTDPSTQYLDLQSDAINVLTFTGTGSAPTTIQQALANHNFANHAAANLSLTVMPVNTTAAPFNNVQAREALNYCLDRTSLSKYTTAGYATPAWVFAGPAAFFYPTDKSGTQSIAAAHKLQPYQFNLATGTQLVKQLGGLSFTMTTFQGQQVVIATAMQQQYAQCGINMKINAVAPNIYNTLITSGSYQVGLNPSGGQFDPRLVTTYINPTSSLNTHGFNDPVVTAALTKSFADTSTKALRADWNTIWSAMNKSSVLLPVLSSPTYVVYSKCLQNIQYNYGTSFVHSWLSCQP